MLETHVGVERQEKQALSIVASEAMPARERVARAVMLGETWPGEPSAGELIVARQNSLGLELIAHYPAGVALARQEEARRDAYWKTMYAASALLAACNIPHIYIKFRKLYSYCGSGPDVVVRQEHWPQVIAALKREGYRGHTMFKEPNKIMFTRPGQIMTIHLHAGVTWNGVTYLADDSVWQHSSPSSEGAWLELDSEYDLLTNLAHDVFQNFEISLGDMLYLQRFLLIHTLDVTAVEEVAAANGWRLAFRRVYTLIDALAQLWTRAAETGELAPALLAYPYRLPLPMLVRAFGERITNNVKAGHIHPALREAYAYPFFWALKRRHDIPLLAKRSELI